MGITNEERVEIAGVCVGLPCLRLLCCCNKEMLVPWRSLYAVFSYHQGCVHAKPMPCTQLNCVPWVVLQTRPKDLEKKDMHKNPELAGPLVGLVPHTLYNPSPLLKKWREEIAI